MTPARTLAVTLVAATLVACGGGTGCHADGPDPEALPEPPAAELDDHFQAHVLAAESHQAIGRWAAAEADTRGAVHGLLQQVSIGQKVFVPVAVSGYQPEGDGPVALAASLRVFHPDGNKLYDESEHATAAALDPSTPGVVVLSPILDIIFDPGDPTGDYRIETSISDGDRQAHAQTLLTVVAGSMDLDPDQHF